MRELRAINFAQRLLEQGTVSEAAMKRIHVHMIADDKLMREMSVATKLMPTPLTLGRLKAAGRRAADGFLAQHREDLGQRGTVDLADAYS
ncbi:hypothetical protein A3731_20185 [Roseovarius sp. HI0049]|nr:hypothetical protein A3731_20185 [Roseovarius sp. HI0049]